MDSPWAYKLPPELQTRVMVDPKEQFYRTFKVEVTSIQELISELGNISSTGGERQDAQDHVLAAISRLSNEVADAADFVPAYDLRNYTQAVRALSDQLSAATAKFAPKARFHFKARDGTAAARANKSDSRQHQPPPIASRAGIPAGEPLSITAAGNAGSAREVSIAGLTGQYIINPAAEAGAAAVSVTLKDLRRCVVDLSAAEHGLVSLALKDVTGSLVVASRVDGSVHITGVRDSVLVVLARQVRVHECENLDLYLFCGSHPIIEDCRGMRFAPAPNFYLTGKDDAMKNQWDQVDDFKWLKADHSPNWSVLPQHERVADAVWRGVVARGTTENLDQVLNQVGVPVRE